MGAHCIAHWSNTQATVVLSSGEAEVNSVLKAAAEGLYLKHVPDDLQLHGRVTAHTDSGAAVGTVQRQCDGIIEHMEARQMWVQEKVFDG